MILLAIDASMSCSGFAVFVDGILGDYGSIKNKGYKGQSIDRYPKKTCRMGYIMTLSLLELVIKYNPDIIIVEELTFNGIAGIKSIKGLAMLAGMFAMALEQTDSSLLPKLDFVSPSGKDGWRTKVKLKKEGDWKRASVNLVNKLYNLSLKYEDNDVTDAILLGHSQIIK